MRLRIRGALACLGALALTSCATAGDDGGGITDYWPAPSLSSSVDPTPPTAPTLPEAYEPLPGCEAETGPYCSSLTINGFPVVADGACPPEYEGQTVIELQCLDGFWRTTPAG